MAYQDAAAIVARLERSECGPRASSTIPPDAIRVGLRVAEQKNPSRRGTVLDVRDIAINPGGPEFRFALVELDGVRAFGQPVRHLYLVDALRYPPG
ncbi:MAG: hypothetical protein U0R66_17470 [Mycobacterium sp.]